MIICIAGKNNIAVEFLKYLLEYYTDYQILIVCNKTDDGINSWQKSLRFAAIQHNVTIRQLDEIYEISDLVFLSLEFDQIIKPELFVSQQLYNVHFSALPKYKGMFTSIMPILYGEDKTGVTLHRIDAGIDTGEIIDQIIFPIDQNDSARTLYNKYIENGISIIKKNFHDLLNNNITSKRQSIENASYFSKKTIDFSNINIDLKKTAWEIYNQIRAFAFREYQLPKIGGFKIYKSEISSFCSNRKKIGEIQQINRHIIEIQSIDYVLHAYIDFEEELFRYAQNGDINGIQQIKDYGYDIYVRNKLGWNLLIAAVYNEHLDLVKYLLSIGFDPSVSNYKGTTVLMYAMTAASKSGRIDILNEIINCKIDIEAKDDKRLNVLDYAIMYENPSIIEYIRSHYDKIS
jgi:methionyl-tRNA formyltransferase